MTTIVTDMPTGAGLAARLSDRIGAVMYRLWFAKARLSVDGRTLAVAAQTRFAANWIEKNFGGALGDVAAESLGAGAQVRIEIDAEPRDPSPARRTIPHTTHDAAPTPAPSRATAPPAPAVAPSAASYADAMVMRVDGLRHDLSQFIVGPSNELAYSAAVRLADDADRGRHLFIHGSCGLGKTHLLQGLCRRYAAAHKSSRFAYTTAEQFIHLYVTAVRRNRLGEFRRRIRQFDLLAVDDVHFLSAKSGTQTEFMHTFDAIDLQGARLVMASDAHPKLIRELSDALVSRFMSGMVVRVEPPDGPTRLKLVGELAARRGLVLRDTTAEQLAARGGSSVREIEGSLLKLKALAELLRPGGAGEPIGQAMLDRLFGDRPTAAGRRRPMRLEPIIDTVCRTLAVERARVLSRCRHRRVVLARSAVIYLARELTTLSYPELARGLGRPNHSTIVTAAKRVERQIADRHAVPPTDASHGATMDVLIDALRSAVLAEPDRPT